MHFLSRRELQVIRLALSSLKVLWVLDEDLVNLFFDNFIPEQCAGVNNFIRNESREKENT